MTSKEQGLWRTFKMLESGVLSVTDDPDLLREAGDAYNDLMALPKQVLQAMDPGQLTQFARSHKLFVGQLKEEGDDTEGGFHWHPREGSGGAIVGGGPHAHLFVLTETVELEGGFELTAGMILVTDVGGAHPHELENAGRTKVDGKHAHIAVILAGEVEMELVTDENGEHAHDLMVKRSGLGGPHTHKLKLPNGVVLESLTVVQFLELARKSDDGDGASDDPSDVAVL